MMNEGRFVSDGRVVGGRFSFAAKWTASSSVPGRAFVAKATAEPKAFAA